MSMRSKTMRGILFCCGLSVAAGACTGVSESELIGRWRAEYDSGFELLTLNKDRTFRQEITLRDEAGIARVLYNQGTWKFDTDSWPRVTLANCMVALEPDGTVKARIEKPYGLCTWPVERDWLVSSRLRIGSVEGSPFRRLKED